MPTLVPDIWQPGKRSAVMARISGRDTAPERALRRGLGAAGLRFRSYPRLPGHPDIRLLNSRIVIFVHGCFWHGCVTHYRAPATRAQFWSKKIAENKRRDARVVRQLRGLGWRVFTVWECDVEQSLERTINRLRREISRKTPAGPPSPPLRRAEGARRYPLVREEGTIRQERRSRREMTGSAPLLDR
jgi:DNA mismatch endonuclease, patch repair protein